jgi:predicted transcriptional regulator
LQSARTADLEQVDDSRRIQILEFIKCYPGTHLRRIRRELNLAMGVLQYHLSKLEKDQRIVSQRRGLYKRFYSRAEFGSEEREILSVLSQETERDLLLYILKTPDATQKELSEFANISASSTSWHMRRLAQAGLVVSRRQGSHVHYMVRRDPVKIIGLLRSYHPNTWERWVDRLADLVT